MGYRCVVWDWNGTLLDDLWLAQDTVNELLVGRGRPPASAARYQEVFGFPLRDFCRRLGFDLETESFETLSAHYTTRYEARRLECRLRDRALQVLAAVQRAGVAQCILSAYLQGALEELVAHFGLRRFFAQVAGLDNTYGEGKAERGRRWLAEAGWSPGQVLMVGDTLYDADVAAALGVDCVLLPSGYQSRQRLLGSGLRVIDDLTEVAAALGLPPESVEERR